MISTQRWSFLAERWAGKSDIVRAISARSLQLHHDILQLRVVLPELLNRKPIIGKIGRIVSGHRRWLLHRKL